METATIAKLLEPFQQAPLPLPASSPESSALSLSQLENISKYLDLLLRWNARVNLTAIREAEEIVTRHFGESLFAGRCLFSDADADHWHVVDVGSGAGFPGLPMKILAPAIRLTLIESSQKKATFLREVVRKLGLTDVEMFARRAEEFKDQAEVVTLRAVERFEEAVPIAGRLMRPGGRLALLIGEGQMRRTKEILPNLQWGNPVTIPLSSNRVLLIGNSTAPQNHSRYESA